MNKYGTIVIITTRWNEDDLIGRLTDPLNPYYSHDEAKLWRKIELPALAEENDILGRAEGEALWPERFDVEYLDEIKHVGPARVHGALPVPAVTARGRVLPATRISFPTTR